MTNSCLIAGAASSAIAALLHLGCIVFGPSWYRFFGAGERMARLAAAGHIVPALVTVGIAAVLIVWSLYALSGAGVIGSGCVVYFVWQKWRRYDRRDATGIDQ